MKEIFIKYKKITKVGRSHYKIMGPLLPPLPYQAGH